MQWLTTEKNYTGSLVRKCRVSSDLMSSLQRITSASWLEQLYDTIELKQDDLKEKALNFYK